VKGVKEMNVQYTDINCQDAAKSIGVSISAIQGWCRKNLINFVDIGDGNKNPRYMISEQEVNYLRSLVKSHGKRKAMLFYDKRKNAIPTSNEAEETPVVVETPIVEVKKVQFNCDVSVEDKQVIDHECEKLGLTRANYIHMLLNKKDSVSEKTEEDIPTRKPFDKEEAMATLSYIQDIKERLEDIEAEKNQLLNELELMKKELIESL
jgi:hypothetical protein